MDEANGILSFVAGRALRLLAKYSGKHFNGLQMAAHANRRVLSSGMRRRLQQVGIAYQVVRHHTEQWEDGFFEALEQELVGAFPGRRSSKPVCAPRFSRNVTQRSGLVGTALNRDAAPFAMPQVEPLAAVPVILEQAKFLYDSQLIAYQGLVESQNSSIAALQGIIDSYSHARKASETDSGEPSADIVSETSSGSAAASCCPSPRAMVDSGHPEIVAIAAKLDAVPNLIDRRIHSALTEIVPSVTKSLSGSMGDVVSNILGATLPGAIEAAIVPRMDQMFDAVASRVSEYSARAASSAGTPQRGGDGAELEGVEQMVKDVVASQLEVLKTQFLELTARVEALGATREVEKRPPATGLACSADRARSPVLPMCRYGRQCKRSDCIFRHPEGQATAASARVHGGRPATSPGRPHQITLNARPIDYGRFDDIVDAAEAEEVQDFILAGLFGDPMETELPPEPDVD
ncbi:unnamed protein product [Prorocentrum cordatum]|uniref:C3H1-type domain-containing protein n=1 Tax=Prorocentrum cordatum TaxID=2364126 RepID=A0ABN9R121_9DINO|nr:unnamed protein product [Polarella glacialis]